MDATTIDDITVSSNVESAAAMAANFATEAAVVEEKVAEPAAAVVAPPVAPVTPAEPDDPDAISERRADGTFKSAKDIRKEFNDRLKKQTWQLRETERKLADAGKATPAPAVAAPVKEPDKPAAFAFEKWEAYSTAHPDASYDDYIDARTDARTEFNLQAERARIDRESADRESLHTLQNLTNLGRKDHADFDAVMKAALETGAQFSPLLTDAILHDESGHTLAYRLAKDPSELQRLSAITSTGALARALVPFLAVATATQGSVAPPAITTAAPPIKPVGSAPVTADLNAVSEDDSVDDHIRKMNALDRAKARTR